MGVLTVVYQKETAYLTYPAAPNTFYEDTLMHQRFWGELDLDLDPIYSFQLHSRFRYGGRVLNNIQHLPKFYVVQPGTTPLSGLNEIADQANAVYFNVRLFGPDTTVKPVWRNLTFIVGITHDKLETGYGGAQYNFPNGGMEFTFLLDKNFAFLLHNMDFKWVNLICNLDLRAGFFLPGSTIQVDIEQPDTVIKSVGFQGYVWQEKNPYLGGLGWQVSANFEIGGVPIHCGWGYHWAFAVGVRTMAEGLYTSPQVELNKEAPRRLSIANYAVFFVGPNISIKYLIFHPCKKQS